MSGLMSIHGKKRGGGRRGGNGLGGSGKKTFEPTETDCEEKVTEAEEAKNHSVTLDLPETGKGLEGRGGKNSNKYNKQQKKKWGNIEKRK